MIRAANGQGVPASRLAGLGGKNQAGSLSALVYLPTRADVRNDNLRAFHPKKDSKIADSRGSLIVPALQRFRVLRVERIALQLFEFLL
jgi:hypothetical protein